MSSFWRLTTESVLRYPELWIDFAQVQRRLVCTVFTSIPGCEATSASRYMFAVSQSAA